MSSMSLSESAGHRTARGVNKTAKARLTDEERLAGGGLAPGHRLRILQSVRG